jgi:thiosulfate/3-mercaptopyruvate sulfurtransferase
MVRLTRRLFIASTVLLAPVQGALAAATPASGTPTPADYAHPEWLVETAWLSVHLADPTLKVVGLTPAEDFAAGHIPGAAQIDWPDLKIVETSDQAVATWETAVDAKLTTLGLAPTDTLVIYDGGTVYAPRLWWILRQLGHADVRIFNGGLPAWVRDGGKIELGVSTVQPATTPFAGTPDGSAITTLAEAVANVGKSGVSFVDARTTKEYIAGHIPGAVNIPFTDNATSEAPHRWKSAEDLRAMYVAAGIAPDQHVIAYCSTGVRSAATYFTLLLIGYRDVSLFTGSWTEWSKHPELPVKVGSEP